MAKSNRAPQQADNRGALAVPINNGVPEPTQSLDIQQLIDSAQVATPSAQLTGVEALTADPTPTPQGQPAQVTQPVASPTVTEPPKTELPAAVEPPATTQVTTHAVQPAPAPDKQAQQHQPQTDPLVERFRSMTPEQQAEAYVNLERLRGKQGEELGLLRKLAERVVLGQVPVPGTSSAQPAPAPNKIDLKNREELVTKLLTEPDAVFQAVQEQVMGSIRSQTAQERFNSKMSEVKARYDSDPAFANFLDSVPMWIKSAATTPEAIDDVIRTYSPQTTATPAPRPQAPAQIGVGAAPSAAAKPNTTGRIYTTAELTEMMMRRPQEYAALQADIWKASEEGRIR